jgi:DNA-directed RNA polymerase specialized sigma24 family protein
VLVGRLFAEHGRMVLGLCRLVLRDPIEAEDAAQQVFLSAHRAVLQGAVPREAAAWLAAIARNECRARIRARMREPLALPLRSCLPIFPIRSPRRFAR